MAHAWRLSGNLGALLLLGASVAAQRAAAPAPGPYEPAVLVAGQPPALPAISVSGAGEVALEVAVDASGVPTSLDVLTATPPFTQLVVEAVRRWRFDAASEPDPTADPPAQPGSPQPRRPLPSRVLVLAVVNAPVTLGPTLNEPPTRVKAASAEVPWPRAPLDAPPNSPVTAVSETVLVEARVDSTGRISRARIVQSAPPYDAPALDLVRTWTFRPARRGNTTVPSVVYVVFGFPLPSRNS